MSENSMQARPFITVMVLCYNYGHLVSRALDAIAAQSFRDFNIVFIDNGSTDNTSEVFHSFCRNHPDIDSEYLRIEVNQGLTHGWNEGIKAAKGTYLLFNDADDWMEPNCLASLANEAKRTNAERVLGQYQEINDTGKILRVRKREKNSLEIPTTMMQGVIVKREVIIQNHLVIPENTKDVFYYDAWLLSQFAHFSAHPIATVPETVYNYFYNPDSVTKKISKNLDRVKNRFINRIVWTHEWVQPFSEELKDQTTYLMIRDFYAQFVSCFFNLDSTDACRFYRDVHSQLLLYFPDYWKNRYLFPFGNHFEFPGSAAVWGIIILERIGCGEKAMALAGRLHRRSKTGLFSKYVGGTKLTRQK